MLYFLCRALFNDRLVDRGLLTFSYPSISPINFERFHLKENPFETIM